MIIIVGLIVGGVLSIIWGILSFVFDSKTVFDFVYPVFMLMVLISMGLCLFINSPTKEVTKSISTTDYIDTLETNVQTNGNFFLGCGQLNSNSVYYALVKTNKGDQMHSFDASRCYVREQNGISPRIVEIKQFQYRIVKNVKLAYWFDPLLELKYQTYIFHPVKQYNQRVVVDYYTIYIPTGSIDRSFKAG